MVHLAGAGSGETTRIGTPGIDRGLTVAEVQFLLGHSDMATTTIYTHADPVQLREKVQGGDQEPTPEQRLAEALAGLSTEQREAVVAALTATE